MAGQRGLLRCGTAAAAFFVLVFLVNDQLKPDYRPIRDYVSEASIGRGGWVQIANFIVTGALVTASSFALARVVSRWTGWLTRVFGLGLIASGGFVTDRAPVDHPTWHGNVHNIMSLVVFGSISAACFTAARWRPTPWWSWYCRLTGVAVPLLFLIAGGVGGDTTGLWQRLTIVVGWSWLAALTLRAARTEGGERRGRRASGRRASGTASVGGRERRGPRALRAVRTEGGERRGAASGEGGDLRPSRG